MSGSAGQRRCRQQTHRGHGLSSEGLGQDESFALDVARHAEGGKATQGPKSQVLREPSKKLRVKTQRQEQSPYDAGGRGPDGDQSRSVRKEEERGRQASIAKA